MKVREVDSEDSLENSRPARPGHFKPSRIVAELAGGIESLGDVISRLYPGMSDNDLTVGDRAYIERNIFWQKKKRRWDYHPPRVAKK